MRNRVLAAGVILSCVGITSLVVSAGDLNPPPGPVSPTMHSLEDIYQAVRPTDPCQPCIWDHKAIPLLSNQYQVVLVGSGVLHSIFLNPNDSVEFYDSADAAVHNEANYLGAFFNVGSAATVKNLDIDLPYEHGLVAVVNYNLNKPIVFKYRPN